MAITTIFHSGESSLEYERARLARGYNYAPKCALPGILYEEACMLYDSTPGAPLALDPRQCRDNPRIESGRDWVAQWNTWVEDKHRNNNPTPAEQLSDFPNNQLLLLCPLP